MEGVIVLTKQGGWKVFEVGVFGVDGRHIDPPATLAATYPGDPGTGPVPTTLDAAKAWFGKPKHRGLALFAGLASLKVIPKVLLALGAVFAAAFAVFQRTGKRKG